MPLPIITPLSRPTSHFGDDLPVLMTDKDAVKCRDFARPDWWRVPVRAVLPAAFYEALAERLDGLRRDTIRRPT